MFKTLDGSVLVEGRNETEIKLKIRTTLETNWKFEKFWELLSRSDSDGRSLKRIFTASSLLTLPILLSTNSGFWLYFTFQALLVVYFWNRLDGLNGLLQFLCDLHILSSLVCEWILNQFFIMEMHVLLCYPFPLYFLFLSFHKPSHCMS